jgi:hypothetical protein
MKGRRDEGIMGQDGQEDKALICLDYCVSASWQLS